MARCLLCVVAVLFALVGQQALYGQPVPHKWGEVALRDLQQTAFAADSNAAAVILGDYGKVDFKPDGRLVFKRHTRIQILSEAGYDWATVTIPYVAAHKLQKVSGVGGQTFTLGADGRRQRHKLDKQEVFEEDLGGQMKQLRFTLPAVQPGAIIEYRYTIQTDHPLLFPHWQFQATEPVRWSAYEVEIPDVLDFAFITYGGLPYVVEERDHNARKGMVTHRWAMEDVPALREEPFMTTPSDYMAALELQLRSFLGIDLLTSWGDMANGMFRSGAFGRFMEPDSLIRARALAATEGHPYPVDKMKALYDLVRTSITWDGTADFTPSRPLVETLARGSGTSADKTMLLIALLRAVDLKADPVLLSTRDNGRVIESYPVLSQFNYILASLDVGGKTYILDPTDEARPYDLLPPRALNGRGLLLREQRSGMRSVFGTNLTERDAQWIDIEAGGTFKQATFVTAHLDSTGAMAVTLQASDAQYSAFEKRTVLSEMERDAFVREVVLEAVSGAEVDSCAIQHEADITANLRTDAAFVLPGYAQVAGDFIYLNPSVLQRFEENPFTLPERTFPVDLTYPRDLSYVFRLTIPPGYTVEEMPESLTFSLPSKGAGFLRNTTVQGQTFSMHTRIIFSADWFPAEAYQDLRAFFDDVVAAQAEQVVLKREDIMPQ